MLRSGGVVAYPTETFYGLAVDALNQAALARLLACKGRSAERTISLIVVGPSDAGDGLPGGAGRAPSS